MNAHIMCVRELQLDHIPPPAHAPWLPPPPGSGTFEAVQLIAASYPTRIPYADIHGRYKEHMPGFVQALHMSYL